MEKSYIIKKRNNPIVPSHKNCLFSSKGYSLFEKNTRKSAFVSSTMDTECCEFIFSKKTNNYFLGLWIPVETQILHELSGNNSIIPAGEYRIINISQLAGLKPLKKQDYIKWKAVFFSPQLIKDVLEHFEIEQSIQRLEFSIKPKPIHKLLKIALSEFEESFEHVSNQDNHLLVEEKALQIIKILLKHHFNNLQIFSKKELSKEQRPVIKRTMDYIRDNFNKYISLDDIASSLVLNKQHLVELFKKETGETPFSYLINYRLNRAKELLKNRSLSIEKVVETIGYQDERQFRRLFKANTGYTVSEFREKS